jgi:hypothetical protein
MPALWNKLVSHQKVIVLTFEIFWIAVFLLEAASGGTDPASMQFIYSNF